MPPLFSVSVCGWIQIKRGNIQENVLWLFLLLLPSGICSYSQITLQNESENLTHEAWALGLTVFLCPVET